MPYKDKNRKNVNRKAKRRQLKEMAVVHFGSKCHDCSGVFPEVVYDFHHLNPNEKDFSLTESTSYKWEVVIKELEKCIMLCSNCHRIRHLKGV